LIFKIAYFKISFHFNTASLPRLLEETRPQSGRAGSLARRAIRPIVTQEIFLLLFFFFSSFSFFPYLDARGRSRLSPKVGRLVSFHVGIIYSAMPAENFEFVHGAFVHGVVAADT